MALTTLGSRGHHFWGTFIITSGFVIGVGMLADKALKKMTDKVPKK